MGVPSRTSAPTPALDQTFDIQIILGKVRPFLRRLAEAHPQVLIIAPIAHALDVQTVTPSPTGDKAGEEIPSCTYGFDGGIVTSDLFTSSALPVDAGHMFVFYTTSKPDEEQ